MQTKAPHLILAMSWPRMGNPSIQEKTFETLPLRPAGAFVIRAGKTHVEVSPGGDSFKALASGNARTSKYPPYAFAP